MVFPVIRIRLFILQYFSISRCLRSFNVSQILAIWEGFFTSLTVVDDPHNRHHRISFGNTSCGGNLKVN